MLGCCGVVVAQWSERRQLRSEALDSIPSSYPCIFLQYVSILIYHQLLTTSSYRQLLLISIVTKIIMCTCIHASADTISSITILLPPNFAAAIPTNVEVVFQANVSATFDQQYLGTIQYSWDFGDGNVVVVSTATVSHTYVVGQLRHISLTVHNDVSTSTIGLNILVLAPPGEVTINVVAGDQLAAGSPISFSISERSVSLCILALKHVHCIIILCTSLYLHVLFF